MGGINCASSVDENGTPKNEKDQESSNVCFEQVFNDFMTPEKS
jgi:hypothetical protein